MATNLYNPLRIFSLSFLLLACFCHAKSKQTSRMSGMFIFGSSVVDNGNSWGAKHPPYGIDFPNGSSTGRPTNGMNVADLVGWHLGLPLIPSFADTQSENASVTFGVNFGYSGSGILNETGGQVVSLSGQITNFETITLPTLEAKLGSTRIKILDKYLFMLAAGNNDYSAYLTAIQILPPQEYAAMLISNYFDQIQRLYNFGARKFLLLSAFPLGCSPLFNHAQGCTTEINDIISIFYDQLVSKIDQITPKLRGSKFVVVNSVKIFTDIIHNPGSTGFTNVTGACCEASYCLPPPLGNLCENRNEYVYFDHIHTTQALNVILAEKTYWSKDTSEVYPYNLYKLVRGSIEENMHVTSPRYSDI